MLVNLTPHSINIITSEGVETTLPKCENPPRLNEEVNHMDYTTEGVEIVTKQFDLDCDLPPVKAGVYYIVPILIAQQIKYRDDLLVTDDPIRDVEGRIVGCRRLAFVV